MSDLTEFDGCHRDCRKRGTHTLLWGLCEHAEKPEPTISIPRTFIASDGVPSIGFDTFTVTELAERIEKALRTVPVRLGPNALAMLERGGTVGLSCGEYSAMALAVAMDLSGEESRP